MPLFKILAKTSLVTTPNNSTNDSLQSPSSLIEKSPAFPPTAIQLYSTKLIHFLSNTIQSYHSSNSTTTYTVGNDNAGDDIKLEEMRRNLKYLPKQYEILSYQPIHVFEKNNSGSSKQQQQQQEQPNFGLWDCRHTINNQTNSSSTTSILLQSPLQSCYVSSSSTSKPTFLITIDLDTDNLDKVQPTLTSMIHSIIHSIALMKQKETNANQNDDDDDAKKNGHVGSIDDVTLNNLINSIPKFGLAPSTSSSSSSSLPTLAEEDEENSDTISNTNKSNAILNDMNIILCAVLPNNTWSTENNDTNDETIKTENQPMTYKEKQALNLVIYHLLKYSNEINCTLGFLNIRENGDTSSNGSGDVDSSGRDGDDNMENEKVDLSKSSSNDGMGMKGLVPSGMNLDDFGYILRQICLGDMTTLATSTKGDKDDISIMEVDGKMASESDNDVDIADVETDTKQESSQQQQDTSIYYPDTYDVDLIESVYLRSASCAGVWDATTDHLWDALPSPSSSSTTIPTTNSTKKDKGNTNTTSNSSGDEEWLTKLADSVAAYTIGGSMDGSTAGTIAAGSGKSVALDEASLKSGRTSSKNTVVTTKSKRVGRKKVTKKSSGSNGGSNGDGKDDVSDFFTDLLKN